MRMRGRPIQRIGRRIGTDRTTGRPANLPAWHRSSIRGKALRLPCRFRDRRIQRDQRMRVRAGLFVCVLGAGWLTVGCGHSTDRITTPTSPSDRAGSSEQSPDRPAPPPPGSPPPGSPPLSGSCDASKAQWTVGQRASDELLERARVAAGATTARFLRPNQPITTEYFGWRLNLGLNEQDVVRSASCG